MKKLIDTQGLSIISSVQSPPYVQPQSLYQLADFFLHMRFPFQADADNATLFID